MAFYDYYCEECKRTFEVKQGMTEPKYTQHDEVTEGHAGLPDVCKGKLHRLIGNPEIIFKGSGWTPIHGGKAGSAMRKADQALKAAGIDDNGAGWTIADDKPKEKKKKRNKYIGKLKVD